MVNRYIIIYFLVLIVYIVFIPLVIIFLQGSAFALMPADDISTRSTSPVAAEASLSDEEVASITGSTERLVRAHVYHNRFIRGWQRLRQRYLPLVAEESDSD